MRRDSTAKPATELDSDFSKVEDAHIETLQQSPIRADIPEAVDKLLTRKFDRHIIPWLFGIWLFAFIDRSNIGNAKIDGLVDDLRLDGNKFNIALVVFYIPYILVDVPANWAVKRVKANIFLPALITAWGLVSTFLGFTKSYTGLIVARLFLGLFEGGLLGGMIVYLAMFYRRHQMLYRVGLFYCAAPLSGAFGGLLATGLAQIRFNGYNHWPWIFFIEGIITVCYGIICFFFMPATPGSAKFLTEEEKTMAMRRMKLDSHGATDVDDVSEERFNWHWVKMALLAPQTILSSLAWFFLLVPLYSYSLFLPTIIRGMGYSSTTAQLFTVPPNVLAAILVLITAALSDKIKARGPIMAVGCVVAIAGYIMLLVAKSNSVRYAGTFLVAIGVYPGSPMVIGWLSNNLAPHYVRATGVGLQIAFANMSAFIASFIYVAESAPDYTLGHAISLSSLILCIITIGVQVAYCKWENKKREQGHRDDRLSEGNEKWLGHRHPAYRYTI